MSAKYVVAPKPASAPKKVVARRPQRPRKSVGSSAPPSPLLKDGLPMQAYAIQGADTDQWQLPHHTKGLGVPGKGVEQTVDWTLADRAVLLISRYGIDGRRVIADPQLIIDAAKHLAGHYRANGRPIPTALCVFDISE